jgi:hypothetical protein
VPSEPTLPSWRWTELHAALTLLAATPLQRKMVSVLLSGLAKQAPFLNRELLLSEVLAITVCVADSRFATSVEADMI